MFIDLARRGLLIAYTTKYEFSSWIFITVIMAPFIGFVFVRYFIKDRLSNMLLEYTAKSKRRLRWGSFFVFCYIIMTWVGFLMSLS